MEIKETHLSGHRYDIRLPHLEGELPDRFYSRMAEEMIGYVSADGRVRKYTAVFRSDERDGELYITVELRARIMRTGGVSVKKRQLCQRWKGGTLVSFTGEDILGASPPHEV